MMQVLTQIIATLIGITAVTGCRSRGVEMVDIPRAVLVGGRGSFLCVAVAPNGKLVAAGNKDGSIVLWDPATGAVKATLTGHGTYITDIAFSPDGRVLASGGMDKTARLWDVALARPITVLGEHENDVQSLAFMPDGKGLATATGGLQGVVRIWDLSTRKARVVLSPSDAKGPDKAWREISQVAFTPDSSALAAAGRGGVHLWDLAESFVRATAPARLTTRMAISPDGKTLAFTTDKGLLLRDPKTGRELGVVKTEKGGSVAGLAFTPDSKRLVIGQGIGPHSPSVLSVYDLVAGRPILSYTTDYDSMRSVAIFPDGKTVATASDDGNVKLWDISPKP